MKIVCYIFHEGNLKSFKVDNLPARVSKPKIMGVKIKNGEEMIDATIEMVDGVMVVSPKVEKFEPKDGDVVFSGSSLISIFKEMTSDTSLAAYAALSKGELKEEFEFWSASNVRPATEEEKKLLFDKLKEEGFEWDAEKKELVKIKWKPSYNGEYYFKPRLDMGQFMAHKTKWLNNATDKVYNKKGWIFKTQKECEAFCDKLNQAIEGVKS